jgi:hypothetical protein
MAVHPHEQTPARDAVAPDSLDDPPIQAILFAERQH